MGLDDGLADREPHAACAAFTPAERLEDASPLVIGDADALVGEIIEFYAAGSDAERETIRALFRKYDSFAWAVTLPRLCSSW